MINDELLGWATDKLLALDECAPGLLRRLIVAAPMVRQAIFLSLAQGTDDQRPEPPIAYGAFESAVVMRSSRAGKIVKYHFGRVPRGLLAVLERLGARPLTSPRAYLTLWSIFTSADQRKAGALRGMSGIDAHTLRLLDALDPLVSHSEVLKRLSSMLEAQDLNRAIRFVQTTCSSATDDAVLAAVARMQGADGLSRMLERFLRRADRFPSQPVAGDHELRPLNTARDIIAAGREYRNCLGSMVGEALVGRVAFAEFVAAEGKVICEFRPLTGAHCWLLASVHAPRNDVPLNELRYAAERKCVSLGVPHIASPQSAEWRSTRRMLRHAPPFGLAA